jgi:hypothetical protein
MSIEGARRVMETTSYETANQYLRFGWTLINQHVVEATAGQPATIKYVLASVRRLEDTREVLVVSDPDAVNRYLKLGWKLIDKFLTAAEPPEGRHETPHFVLAWQRDEPPERPGGERGERREFEVSAGSDDELLRNE